MPPKPVTCMFQPSALAECGKLPLQMGEGPGWDWLWALPNFYHMATSESFFKPSILPETWSEPSRGLLGVGFLSDVSMWWCAGMVDQILARWFEACPI